MNESFDLESFDEAKDTCRFVDRRNQIKKTFVLNALANFILPSLLTFRCQIASNDKSMSERKRCRWARTSVRTTLTDEEKNSLYPCAAISLFTNHTVLPNRSEKNTTTQAMHEYQFV